MTLTVDFFLDLKKLRSGEVKLLPEVTPTGGPAKTGGELQGPPLGPAAPKQEWEAGAVGTQRPHGSSPNPLHLPRQAGVQHSPPACPSPLPGIYLLCQALGPCWPSPGRVPCIRDADSHKEGATNCAVSAVRMLSPTRV